MRILVNPGSGDVSGATFTNAHENIHVFADDLRAAHGYAATGVVPALDSHKAKGLPPKGGRYQFKVICVAQRGPDGTVGDETTFEVDMPGLPLEQVRYTGPPQDPFDFPRLYVNGSSWLWKFGVAACGPDANPVSDL